MTKMEGEYTGQSAASSLDQYDMTLAQMQGQMSVYDDELESLEAASGNSDDELRMIMEQDNVGSNTGPSANHPLSSSIRKGFARDGASRGVLAGSGGGAAGGREISRGQALSSAGVGGISAGKENKSRARPKKPHEPDPFLSINMLPVDKHLQQPLPTRDRNTASMKGQQIAKKRQMLNASVSNMRAPPGTPSHPVFSASRSRLSRRSASSAVSSEWNPLVPKQKLVTAAALDNPVNTHVKVPFKHTVKKPNMEKGARPMSPAQTMKERTSLATYHVARTIARQKGEEDYKKPGRLLKGKLKPLYPVRQEGPTMRHCRGVISEVKSYLTRDSKTLERRQQIVADMMNNKDFKYERPGTAESVQHTSVASHLSENREKDLQEEIDTRNRESDTLSLPHDGICEPPNSLASASDANIRNQMRIMMNANSGQSNVFTGTEDGDGKLGSSGLEHLVATESICGDERSEQGQRDNSAISRRPNTGKAVRFADKDSIEGNTIRSKSAKSQSQPDCEVPASDNKDMDKDKEPCEISGRCKPLSKEPCEISGRCKPDDLKNQDPRNSDDDDDGGNNGHRYEASPNGSSLVGSSQGHGKTQGSTSDGHDNVQSTDCPTGNSAQDRQDNLQVTYSTVLFTTDDPKSPIPGKIPLPAGGSPQKPQGLHLTLAGHGKGSPDLLSDHYDKYAWRPQSANNKKTRLSTVKNRPQSANPKVSGFQGPKSRPNSVVRLRRPLSASTVSNRQEQAVNFLIRSKTDGEDVVLDSDQGEVRQTHRMSEIKSKGSAHLVSARKREVRESATAKKEEDGLDFHVEGAKMSQGIKAGICTECGRPTNKIAEYWEETGALVCETCDRRMHADERRRCDQIRQEVYRQVRNGEIYSIPDDFQKQDNTDDLLGSSGKAEDHGTELMTNIEELEKSLKAACLEIESSLKEAKDELILEDQTSEESDSNDSGAVKSVRVIKDTCNESTTSEDDPPPEEQVSQNDIMEGEISKILTEVDANPSEMTQYEMRVYWYKEYANAEQDKAKRGISLNAKSQCKSEDMVFDALKTTVGQRSEVGEINTYNVTMMADQSDDLVATLMAENDDRNLAPQNMQHFKGQCVPKTANRKEGSATGPDQLEVEGTAAKMVSQRPNQAPSAVAPFAPVCFRINARPPPGFLYYFAYGADMNADRMSTYLQRSVEEDRSWGLLYGFRLVFNKRGVDVEAGGFPNIELHSTSSVEGSLYLITSAELEQLDHFLGYPEHYDHAMLPVWLLNCSDPDEYGVAQYCVPALVYVAKDDWIQKGGRPLNTSYAVDQCDKAGRNLLTPAYRQHLQSLRTSLPVEVSA